MKNVLCLAICAGILSACNLQLAIAYEEHPVKRFISKVVRRGLQKHRHSETSKVPRDTSPPAETEAPLAPEILSDGEILFHDSFEEGKPAFPGWTGFMKSGNAAPDSAEIVSTSARDGSFALKLTVNPGDFVTDGDIAKRKERLELVRNVPTEGLQVFVECFNP